MSFVNRLAVALTAVVAATTATSVGRAEREDRHRHVPVGPGGRAVRRAGEELRRVRGRSS